MIKIEIKLPEYCKTTTNPRFKIVQVKTPEKWLSTYREISSILLALSNCEKYNRDQGQKQFSVNEKEGDQE